MPMHCRVCRYPVGFATRRAMFTISCIECVLPLTHKVLMLHSRCANCECTAAYTTTVPLNLRGALKKSPTQACWNNGVIVSRKQFATTEYRLMLNRVSERSHQRETSRITNLLNDTAGSQFIESSGCYSGVRVLGDEPSTQPASVFYSDIRINIYVHVNFQVTQFTDSQVDISHGCKD